MTVIIELYSVDPVWSGRIYKQKEPVLYKGSLRLVGHIEKRREGTREKSGSIEGC